MSSALHRLPVAEGAFSLELGAPTEFGPTLRYRGLERVRENWMAPESTKEVDSTFQLELPDHPRLDLALDTWLDIVGEVLREQASREEPSLPASAFHLWKPLKKLLANETLDADALRARWRLHFAAYLPPPPALVTAHAAFDGWIRTLDGPLASGEHDDLSVSLEHVSTELKAGAVWATVRLITWQRQENGELMIRDVKEQEVVVLTPGPGIEPDRVVNFFTAWREATSKLLERVDGETLMPHDLILTPQTYKRGQSVDDFRKLLWRKLKLS